MRFAVALLMLTALPASAAAPLPGDWFGIGQPWDPNATYLLTILPDGTFHTHHRFCRKGHEINRMVAGSWALNGDTITYHVQTVDGLPRPRVDIFRLTRLDTGHQDTIFIPRNIVYKAERVGAQFQLPSCELVS